jgi:hypothetical protein
VGKALARPQKRVEAVRGRGSGGVGRKRPADWQAELYYWRRRGALTEHGRALLAVSVAGSGVLAATEEDVKDA